MNVSIILRTLWPTLLVLFLGLSVAQLTERLKNKESAFYYDQNDGSVAEQPSEPMTRANALLGAACIIVTAFWGFDALLSWWMFTAPPS